MASSSMFISFALLVCTLCLITGTSTAQLTTDFYSKTCPQVLETVGSVVRAVVSKEKRMGASLLRLQFHDCFVNGCDGSVLLDDTPSFKGEKTSYSNKNSVRGFNVIDDIKSKVEKVCPGVVSCADILAISARESVTALGGPTWKVKLGRRDSKSASLKAAGGDGHPPPTTLNGLINSFQAMGLSAKDLVVLSGAHTIGQARCIAFRARVYNDTNIDASFAKSLRSNCRLPVGSGDDNLAPLDDKTPNVFDNGYYKNLISQKGLLQSDQQLYSGGRGSTDSLVEKYSKEAEIFHVDFVASMIKMGDMRPLIGSNGEIRKNCRKVNS